MSYLDDIRGALAYTSGAARRVQQLHELGLNSSDEQAVQQWLDDAVDSLIAANNVLKKAGKQAQGMGAISSGAEAQRGPTWQERVYGGKKEPFQTVREKVKNHTPWPHKDGCRIGPGGTPPCNCGAHKAAPPVSTPEIDVAHPWRTEEKQ